MDRGERPNQTRRYLVLPEIAFRPVSGRTMAGWRALDFERAPHRLPRKNQTRMPPSHWPRVRACAKLCAREGNSPDRPLRPPSPCRVAKDVRFARQPGCWLRSSHAFKECVTAHWSRRDMRRQFTAKHGAEAAGDGSFHDPVVGASPGGAKRAPGPPGSENAGMSSERGAGNPSAVSLQGFLATPIAPGSVGELSRGGHA